MTKDELIEKYDAMVWKIVNVKFWSYSESDKDDFAQELRIHLFKRIDYINLKEKEAPKYINGIISKILENKVSRIFVYLKTKKSVLTRNYESLNIIKKGSDREELDKLSDSTSVEIEANVGLIDEFEIIINELNETETEIMLLYFENGLAIREIAEKTGVSKSTIARKIAKFKEKVIKYGI